MNKSLLLLTQSGCLLPLLIFFNLIFGWLFFKPLTWLLIEGFLLLLFFLNSYIIARRFSSSVSRPNKVIDVEGEVLDEKK